MCGRINAGLDLIGAIPFVGELADLGKSARLVGDVAETIKAAKSVGNISDIANGAKTLLPAMAGMKFLGRADDAGDAIRLISNTGEVVETIDDTYDAVKAVEATTDAAKAAENIKKLKPSQLTTTHDITMSKRQFEELVQDIQGKGILEPIKVVKHNGGTYVVDGHHRLRAARQLKLNDVPVQEVNLPYKGYKDINDLLWPY